MTAVFSCSEALDFMLDNCYTVNNSQGREASFKESEGYQWHRLQDLNVLAEEKYLIRQVLYFSFLLEAKLME